MSEADAIAVAGSPATASSILADLRSLGVESGMTLMVHSSLSALGFVVGGAQAVVEALLEAVGPDGTLMMPTHSAGNSDPADWQNPPVPEAWWPTVRDHMPAYDPDVSVTRGMGAVVECFRRVPGVVRSSHPAVSAAAVGPCATQLIADHSLDHGLGEGSPQARLYDLDGHVLLLGVTHANNTSLHLAEYRSAPAGALPAVREGASMTVDGERRWVWFDSIDEDDDDFATLGDAYAETGRQHSGPAGTGTAHVMRVRDVVDFGVEWLRAHRHDG